MKNKWLKKAHQHDVLDVAPFSTGTVGRYQMRAQRAGRGRLVTKQALEKN